MSRAKKYFESYDELLYLLKKYPADERRCAYRTSFMDPNALKKACDEKVTIIKVIKIFDHERQYVICTATGTIYFVTIGPFNYCTCYMFTNKSIQCKHIINIMIKPLRIPIGSPLLYQNGFKPSEARKIFAHSKVVLSPDKQLMNKYKQMAQTQKIEIYVKRSPVQEDCCSVCLSKIKENEKGITWCRSKCGRNVHIKCLGSSKSCPRCGVTWLYANEVTYPNIFA
eukprot:59515_1